jgi:hypothetical protein
MKKIGITIAVFLISIPFIKAQLVVQSGATIKTTGNAIITLQDINLVNDGTISQQPGEGKFVFNGSANNTISGNSIPLFDIMEIAKTGGTKISLLQNINIGSSINFTAGLIDLNTKNILLQSAALLIGENENSRIMGNTGGYVEITRLLNAPAAVNPGNLGAMISTTQNMGSTLIRRGHVSQVNGNNAGNSIYRYFDIVPVNNSVLNATLRINYFDAELNGLTENTLVLWKSPDNVTWQNMGFDTRDGAANYVQKAGLADFSRWTLSSATNVLLVHFMLFNLNCTGNAVSLTWKTAQEQNSASFQVQRSDDGIHFTTIGTEPAAGNSSIEKTYFYTDNTTSFGTSYYRIAETGIDGRLQYTGTNKVQCGAITDELKIWPNPVQQALFINITAMSASPASIKIFDNKGALVRIEHANLLRGNNMLSIDMSRLASGNYNMAVEWNNGVAHKTMKLTKQ